MSKEKTAQTGGPGDLIGPWRVLKPLDSVSSGAKPAVTLHMPFPPTSIHLGELHMSKQPENPPHNIQLPDDEERELLEEIKATGRSANAIVLESLRLRRVVLEALGVETAGTEPGVVAQTAKKAIEAGQRHLKKSRK